MNKKEKSEFINNELKKLYPNPTCELTYKKDYELLLKVMLSAQTTDKRVNEVCDPLFNKYDTLEKLDKLSIKEIEQYIKSIGMYKQKSKHFKNIVSYLVSNNKVIPREKSELMKLDGVGNKTANVVLSNLYDEPLIAVDTHVFRTSKRLGLTKENDDVKKTEEKLMKCFKKEDYKRIHHSLVLFGRYICTSKSPSCDKCPFNGICQK